MNRARPRIDIATSDKQATTSDRQVDTSDQQASTSDKQVKTSDKQGAHIWYTVVKAQGSGLNADEPTTNQQQGHQIRVHQGLEARAAD